MAVIISTRCGLFDRIRRPAIVVMKPPASVIQIAQSSVAPAIVSRAARIFERAVSRRGSIGSQLLSAGCGDPQSYAIEPLP